jgi:hypothetical protein
MGGYGPGGAGYGPGMMGGVWQSSPSGHPLNSRDDANQAFQGYIDATGNSDLVLDDVMQFEFNYYAIVDERSTGHAAFELLADPQTGAAFPEFGPKMMWNTRYAHMTWWWGQPHLREADLAVATFSNLGAGAVSAQIAAAGSGRLEPAITRIDASVVSGTARQFAAFRVRPRSTEYRKRSPRTMLSCHSIGLAPAQVVRSTRKAAAPARTCSRPACERDSTIGAMISCARVTRNPCRRSILSYTEPRSSASESKPSAYKV